MTASMKLHAFITLFKKMENKKDFFASPRLLFSTKWEKEEKKLALLFSQAKHFASNARCFHQKRVLSPEVTSATGKMPHSEWWLMRAVNPTGMPP